MVIKLLIKKMTMKKLILLICLIISISTVFGQRSIDALFEKYSGKDGFVTVSFSGDLLSLILDEENKDNLKSSNITELRILVQEHGNLNVENFYELVKKGIDISNYEEFMKVKESDQDLRMLVKAEGNKFREFLLIAGGKDNAIIQVKGNLSFRDAKKFSEDAKNHNLELIDNHK